MNIKMKLYLTLILFICSLNTHAGSGKVPSSFEMEMRMDPWSEAESIKLGWDWSLPEWVKPDPSSGIKLSETKAGDKFPGRLLHSVNTSWNAVEPEEGRYDFEPLRRAVLSASENGKYGIEFHLRGSVWELRNFPDEANYPRSWENQKIKSQTAPRWLAKYNIPLIEERKHGVDNIATPFQIVNMDIYHREYHKRYIGMLEALGRSGILDMPEVTYVFLHIKSGSRGEEGAGPVDGPERDLFIERLETWAKISNGNERKLCLVSHKEEDLSLALKLGMGQRNGFVEMYLLHCANTALGQSIDKDGYLVVDENNPIILENRASGDENEEYVPESHVPRFGSMETWGHRYRESSLRALQMRRNFLWAEGGSYLIDPPLLAYVSLELGKNRLNAPDAWCRLRESMVRSENHHKATPIGMKNFERWLFQRDSEGYETEAVKKVMHGKDYGKGSLVRTYIAGHNYDFTARKGKRIGFAVDDKFLSDGPHRVMIKVTFYDESIKPFYLKCDTSEGEVRKIIHGTGDGQLKTASLIVDSAVFNGRNYAGHDFTIGNGADPVVLAFVRIIKLRK